MGWHLALFWPVPQGNDEFQGTPRRDVLYGLGGNDTIFGLAGNDEMYGGAGRDDLRGNDGNDELYGGSGVDTLVGGNGADFINSADRTAEIISCGEGTDTYVADTRDTASMNCERNVGDMTTRQQRTYF